MVLCDKDIRRLCVNAVRPMIEPFSEAVSGDGVISAGLSSAGYDMRLGGTLRVYKATSGLAVDAKRFGDIEYVDKLYDTIIVGEGGKFTLMPGQYVLGHSLEYFRMPCDVIGIILGKSTLARCMTLINTTPAEPGWEGQLTIEIGNVGPLPLVLYPGEGIAQMLFLTLSDEPETDYAQKKGQYQSQTGVTLAKVRH